MGNLLFPNGYKCLVCGKEIKPSNFDFCDSCFLKLKKITGKVCLKCGEQLCSDATYCLRCKNEQPNFTKAFAPFEFDGEIKNLIYNLKYNKQTYVAKTLSNLILKYFLESGLKVDVVIPVPLYLSREFKRGFNQSELLIQSFSDNGFIINNSCLVRVKETSTQTALTKAERKLNVENAFRVVNQSVVKNKNVLVVDDVYTTGATFSEVAKVLFSAGAKNVYCLSVAHTKLENS